MVLEIDSLNEGNDLRKCFFRADAHAIQAVPPAHGRLPTIRTTGVARAQDPFRWTQLRTIISNTNTARLLRRRIDDPIPDHEIYRNGTVSRRVTGVRLRDTARQPQDAGGITIPGRWVLTGNSHYSGLVAMSEQATLVIYRDDPLASSLPHELFGHAFLSLLRAPEGHGGNIGSNSNVPTPFTGVRFEGTVDDYLDHIVGHGTPPTHLVSTDYLLAALAAFKSAFNGAASPNPNFRTVPNLISNWRILTSNYRIMTRIRGGAALAAAFRGLTAPAAGGTAANAGDLLLGDLVAFHGSLSGSKQTDFRNFVHHFQMEPQPDDPFAAHRNALLTALQPRIPT